MTCTLHTNCLHVTLCTTIGQPKEANKCINSLPLAGLWLHSGQRCVHGIPAKANSLHRQM